MGIGIYIYENNGTILPCPFVKKQHSAYKNKEIIKNLLTSISTTSSIHFLIVLFSNWILMALMVYWFFVFANSFLQRGLLIKRWRNRVGLDQSIYEWFLTIHHSFHGQHTDSSFILCNVKFGSDFRINVCWMPSPNTLEEMRI